LSNDLLFADRVHDVVGLYLDPPESAVVLCVDEKSRIQALGRSRPALPMMPGMPGRRTRDYVRHGTTSLFAAMNVADGTVIGATHRRHRAAEFVSFLGKIDAEVPDGLDVHVVCDNYGTHKTPSVNAWLERHPRFHMRFTPTYSSWLNQVGHLFAEITRRMLHRSVQALERDVLEWARAWNENPGRSSGPRPPTRSSPPSPDSSSAPPASRPPNSTTNFQRRTLAYISARGQSVEFS